MYFIEVSCAREHARRTQIAREIMLRARTLIVDFYFLVGNLNKTKPVPVSPLYEILTRSIALGKLTACWTYICIYTELCQSWSELRRYFV